MKGPRILLVDDDPSLIASLNRLLRRAKFEVFTADNGERALELLPTVRPDVILLDIMMPGLSGYEVCQRIRADRRYRFLKILLLSGKSSTRERLDGYAVGADDYLAKPFENEELLAKLRVYSRLKRSEEIDAVGSNLFTLFSHETRTPLSTILGALDILSDDSNLAVYQRDLLAIIRRGGERLLEMVHKTSLLCLLKRNTQLLRLREPLAPHVQSVLAKLTTTAEAKGLALDSELTADLDLDADWSLVEEILTYIVENALEHSPPSGRVRITTHIQDGRCLLRVADQGKGIPREWLDKIFDEFEVRDLAHHQQGLGLSLAIARHVMELHAGTIQADAAPDGGALFTLEFPVTPSPSGNRERQTTSILV
jgi:two-component system sensor histidine kinase/response regulator